MVLVGREADDPALLSSLPGGGAELEPALTLFEGGGGRRQAPAQQAQQPPHQQQPPQQEQPRQHRQRQLVPSVPARPATWYAAAHAQPALARRGAEAYPAVAWPRHGGAPSAPPGAAELARRPPYAPGSRPIMVVAYNGSFFGERFPTRGLDCAVPCVLTSDVAALGARADVLVFHAPGISRAAWDALRATPKPAGQLWALHSMESEESNSVQAAGSPLLRRVDLQATYKLRWVGPPPPAAPGGVLDHVPVPYLNSGQYAGFAARRPDMYAKAGLALWMHNNCDALSSREALVAGLMAAGLPVDAPGACLHNVDAPGGLNSSDPTALMAQYKFYLVFENVFDDPDWVSSTFFRALDAGTVPVVLGAPNVLKFAPAPRSVIRACDFDSPADLVEYLLYLDRNATAYTEYLAWKEAGPSQAFAGLMAVSDVSPWCRMCVAAAARHTHAYDDAARDAIARHASAKRAFDALNARLDAESSEPCRGAEPWWHIPLSAEEEARHFGLAPPAAAPVLPGATAAAPAA
ncbi:FUT11 [Scenedesmus sp. PABB004]|nr:FUT11 [Scenedesmus sp. PABB004]